MLPRIDGPSECPSVAYNRAVEISTRQDRGATSLLHNVRVVRSADHCNVGKVAIKMLPEEVLLEIFSFYMCGVHNDEEWETLVHVCRRWRSIVFAAPRRLNLKLVCTRGTPVRKTLDIWPPLPIAVRVRGGFDQINENVLVALEQHDRVCKVHVDDASCYDELKELVGAMQVPYPALTDIHIHALFGTHSFEGPASYFESLLGGSAPNLRSLSLMNIGFRSLPKLLLSFPGLVSLSLFNIPYSGHTPCDAMVDCLSSLTRLESLQINFPITQLRSVTASRRQAPLTRARTVFPVLSKLLLKGATKYLDRFSTYVEAPLLHHVRIGFLDPPIFDTSRIARWIGCAETFDQAYICFHHVCFKVVISLRKRTTDGKTLTLSLLWNHSSWKLWELTLDSCDCSFEPFDLCPFDASLLSSWERKIGNASWLHLLRFFTSVKHMFLSQGVALHVAPALQELTGERITEVLPVLRNVFVERLDPLGPVQEALGQFVTARRLLSGHSIDVQFWAGSESVNRSGRR